MKGIVLAAGSGTRLYPVTKATAKPLIPVYDKPMIYYPISLLMEAGIKDIMLIIAEKDLDNFKSLFGDGSDFGINIEYGIQKEPNGIAEALIIAEDFVGDDSVALVLGDNLLYGEGLAESLMKAADTAEKGHATVFGYYVDDPRAFGVVGFDENGKPVSLVEKPSEPESNYCVIGVYFYDNRAVGIAKGLTPSARGELEITDVNKAYLEDGTLELIKLPKETEWFDAGTFQSLTETSDFVKNKEKESGKIMACLEEIAYKKGWISEDGLKSAADGMSKSDYGIYLKRLCEGE